jgi:hypothetical protein
MHNGYYVNDKGEGIIPENIVSIECNAFFGCGDLTSISIPEGVVSIGDNAFFCCNHLKSVILPGCITSIGEFAFYSCTNLANVTIPEGVISIGNSAFYDCEKLIGINIPKNVKLGNNVFGTSSVDVDKWFISSANMHAFMLQNPTCYDLLGLTDDIKYDKVKLKQWRGEIETIITNGGLYECDVDKSLRALNRIYQTYSELDYAGTLCRCKGIPDTPGNRFKVIWRSVAPMSIHKKLLLLGITEDVRCNKDKLKQWRDEINNSLTSPLDKQWVLPGLDCVYDMLITRFKG